MKTYTLSEKQLDLMKSQLQRATRIYIEEYSAITDNCFAASLAFGNILQFLSLWVYEIEHPLDDPEFLQEVERIRKALFKDVQHDE